MQSNVKFDELPEWFKNSYTVDACIVYDGHQMFWENGTWRGGVWKNGVWKDGYKTIGFCKWIVKYKFPDIVKIGCEERTVEQWDSFFSSRRTIETRRDEKAFELIHKSYLIAKEALKLGV